MRDVVVLGLMVFGFGLFVTAQVRLVLVLIFSERPRWRGLAAFLFPPLAPFYGWKAGRKINVVAWVSGLVLYGTGFLVATVAN